MLKKFKKYKSLVLFVKIGDLFTMAKQMVKYSGRGNPDARSNRQKSLGSLLKEAREAQGMTQKELAHATDIKIHSIIKYEAIDNDGYGQYPKSQSLAKLCLALKIDPLQAMLACLPREDYGMYESLSNAEAWKHNHPQYVWVEKQLETVTKDLMLLRSFIQHFTPYLKDADLPDDLQWLLEKGEAELDRITDLETRLLQMGVFILPMGSFLMPSGVTDDEGLDHFFDFGKPGVIARKDLGYAATIVRRTLKSYAERFVRLAHQFENLEEEREENKEWLEKFRSFRDEKSPEEDLRSPPSSDPQSTPVSKQENDDG